MFNEANRNFMKSLITTLGVKCELGQIKHFVVVFFISPITAKIDERHAFFDEFAEAYHFYDKLDNDYNKLNIEHYITIDGSVSR